MSVERQSTSEKTAPGPLPESLYGDIPAWDFDFWPTSTTAIMGALFMALGMTLNLQISERIDTALTGGVAFYFGDITIVVWLMAGVVLFGLSGGLIVAWVNPIVANLTATSPLAPAFFATNAAYVIPAAVLIYYLKKPDGGISFNKIFLVNLVAMPSNLLPILFIYLFIVNFTLEVSLFWYLTQVVVGWLAIFIAYPFTKKLVESGVAER